MLLIQNSFSPFASFAPWRFIPLRLGLLRAVAFHPAPAGEGIVSGHVSSRPSVTPRACGRGIGNEYQLNPACRYAPRLRERGWGERSKTNTQDDHLIALRAVKPHNP